MSDYVKLSMRPGSGVERRVSLVLGDELYRLACVNPKGLKLSEFIRFCVAKELGVLRE